MTDLNTLREQAEALGFKLVPFSFIERLERKYKGKKPAKIAVGQIVITKSKSEWAWEQGNVMIIAELGKDNVFYVTGFDRANMTYEAWHSLHCMTDMVVWTGEQFPLDTLKGRGLRD